MENNGKLNVRLRVTTRIHGADGETLEYRCRGELFRKGEAWYLRYKENPAEMGDTTTTLKIMPGAITLIRHGSVAMRQEYAPGVRTKGKYVSPYGTFELEAQTRALRFVPARGRLQSIRWSYDLWLNRESAGRHEIEIAIKEVERDEDDRRRSERHDQRGDQAGRSRGRPGEGSGNPGSDPGNP
ncbi:hypothetical protein BSNK01_17000 [Bacillaceae bacterium]